MARVTLDHNCIIDLLKDSHGRGSLVRALVDDTRHTCCVVDIGASEFLPYGVRPDRYDQFEAMLKLAHLDDLERLQPSLIWDVTFFDHAVWDADPMLASQIETILFGRSPPIDIATVGIDSPDGHTWLNRLCDTHTMWCHIRAGNDVFLTSDSNFHKQTKKGLLEQLGANRICRPRETI